MSEHSSTSWDHEAPTFDDQPDHGLRDPAARSAWRELLLPLFADSAPQTIADLGCGTGTLSVLLAEAGHRVDGVDFSAEMVALARTKATDLDPRPTFVVADAGDPPLTPAAYDTVLCRHALWAIPDPVAALSRWVRLLKPTGQLVLIEGCWSTGAGLTSDECLDLVLHHRAEATVRPLAESTLWGGAITDERYLLHSIR